MSRVLHVTEAYGGGIVTAVDSFVRNSADHQHHLLASIRERDTIELAAKNRFASIQTMPKGVLAAIREINCTYARVQPDYVHLHSSFAGLYGRLSLVPTRKLIYSPHCFAFERQDINRITAFFFNTVENALSVRTGHIAALSQREFHLSQSFVGRPTVHLVPNTSNLAVGDQVVRLETQIGSPAPNRSLVAVTSGRITIQKDPCFLAQAIAALPDISSRLQVYWLGSGDQSLAAALVRSGVEVSGWLAHREIMARIADADLYVHSAAWEGFPMSVIEASAIGKPLLLRKIAAFTGIGLPELALPTTHEEFSAALRRFVGRDPEQVAACRECSRIIRELCTPENQANALAGLYASGSGMSHGNADALNTVRAL